MDYDLRVIGKGPLESEYRRTAADLPVEFCGFVSDRGLLLGHYRWSHVLAVPSFTESFGLVYGEAMTQASPVIYTRGQGFDGFFPDGTVGFAVNPKDAGEIADRVFDLHRNYSFFSRNSVRLAEQFRWADKVSELCRVYDAATLTAT